MAIRGLLENKIFFVALVLAFALAMGLSVFYGGGAMSSAATVQVASNNPGGSPDPWDGIESNNPGGSPDPWDGIALMASNNPGGSPDPWDGSEIA